MDGGPIGVYPVVDRCSWIARLKSQGITTIQLRVKDMQGDALEHEIAATCALARSLQVRLFVNDYWQLAIKHRAYGVHLGQEDLATLNADDLRTLAQSGLRLGLSTHSYEEAAVAHAIKPSYVALGPIFPTTCKSMAFGPHGIDKAPQWVTMLGCPIVAIGGLKVEHVAALRERGVDGVAVISDILYSNTPEQRASEWAQAFERAKFNV
jgi:hydroxymethylpyrimidine kinase/phosphomethylpyrimidine kinase/thiamine-phosphate diphosphorylase